MTAREIAELLGLTAFEPEQIGGARHVDVEEGAPHQEVGGFGRDVLGELGEPLRRDHAGEPALAAAAHQVGHRAERQPPHLVGDLAGDRGREQLRLVDHHQRGIPMLARCIEQGAEEGRRRAHLALALEPLEREHHRDALLAHAQRQPAQLGLAVRAAVDDDMPEAIGQRDEIALGIDDHLLHPRCAALQQAAQQMRLSRARIALHEQPGGEQFLEIHLGGRAVRRGAHVDGNGHRTALRESGPQTPSESRRTLHRKRAGAPGKHRPVHRSGYRNQKWKVTEPR